MRTSLIRRVIIFISAGVACMLLGNSIEELMKMCLEQAGVLVGYGGSSTKKTAILLLIFMLAPLQIAAWWKYLPIHSGKRRKISILVFLACIGLMTTLHGWYLWKQAGLYRDEMGNDPVDEYPAGTLDTGQFHLWIPLSASFLLATVLHFWLLREKPEPAPAFSFEDKQATR